MNWEFGTSRCKLLYIEWINNKVCYTPQGIIFNMLWSGAPLFSIHNGKEYEKITCITESFCYIAEINTMLQINYISMKKEFHL